MTLKIMSYNIHQCVGTDKQLSVDRIVSVISDSSPDIVALQEVRILQEGGGDVLSALTQSGKYYTIPGPTMNWETSSYGNALLLPREPDQLNHISLAVPHREPRGAIQAFFNHGHRRVQVIATHLGLLARERRWQVKEILRHIANSPRTDILILCGDMNEWLLWGRPLRWLHRYFSAPPRVRTFPSRRPILALDRIWVSPMVRLKHIEVPDTPNIKVASDHCPLVATIAT